jgi:pimeloyl-ACP methyl ester carboxylesterase
LTTLADSVAATRRALALQDGPTVLVAHSWGGTGGCLALQTVMVCRFET